MQEAIYVSQHHLGLCFWQCSVYFCSSVWTGQKLWSCVLVLCGSHACARQMPCICPDREALLVVNYHMPCLDPCPAAVSTVGVMFYSWGEIMTSVFSLPHIWAVCFGALGILLCCWSRLYEFWSYLICTPCPVVPWWVSTALVPTPPLWVPSHIFYKTGTLRSPKMQFGKNPWVEVEKQGGFVLDVTSKQPKQ